MTTKIRLSLSDLLAVLQQDPGTADADASSRLAQEHGLPTRHGVLDWTSLPTFGGEAPSDTEGVWSWDEDRLLVGSSASDLTIEPRD